jgi:hypothetical protein
MSGSARLQVVRTPPQIGSVGSVGTSEPAPRETCLESLSATLTPCVAVAMTTRDEGSVPGSDAEERPEKDTRERGVVAMCASA